jgi:hypothetical protein
LAPTVGINVSIAARPKADMENGITTSYRVPDRNRTSSKPIMSEILSQSGEAPAAQA